jgi:hypothetical protein
MTTQPSLPPVQHQVRVALAPADAFDLFTRQTSSLVAVSRPLLLWR